MKEGEAHFILMLTYGTIPYTVASDGSGLLFLLTAAPYSSYYGDIQCAQVITLLALAARSPSGKRGARGGRYHPI